MKVTATPGPAETRARLFVSSLEASECALSSPLLAWYRAGDRIRAMVREVEAEREEGRADVMEAARC